jgi:hypothetical protein
VGEPEPVADDLDDRCSIAGSRRASIGDGAIASATVSRSVTTRPRRSPAPQRSPAAVPEAVFDEFLKAVGDREPLRWPHVVPTAKQRECDLLSEEGIAPRHLVDAQRAWSGRTLADRVQDDPLDVVHGQRPTWTDVHAFLGNAGATPRDRPRHPIPVRPSATPIGSSFRRRTTNCKHASRGQIHPLRVVDGHDNGRSGRHRTDAPQHGQRDGPLVGAPAGRRRSQERHLEGRALRLGERRQALVQDGLDEVAEDGVRETPLGLDGTARERR